MIDVSFRYSDASLRRSKKPESTTDAISKTWISYFGHPRRFLVDNGFPFLNDEHKQMCKQFKIEVSKAAAESLWSNGLCEAYYGAIKKSVRKVVEVVKY